jgi:hypothetical protein
MVMGIDQAQFERDGCDPTSTRGGKLKKMRQLLKIHMLLWIGTFVFFFIFAVVWNSSDKLELDASCSTILVNIA